MASEAISRCVFLWWEHTLGPLADCVLRTHWMCPCCATLLACSSWLRHWKQKLVSFPGPARKIGKGPGSVSMCFLPTFSLPLKTLRSQSDCGIKPRGTWSCHMRTKPKVARDGVGSASYTRVAVVSCLREICGRSKLESAVYPYGLSRQTPRSSVDTGFGPNQLRQSVGIFV